MKCVCVCVCMYRGIRGTRDADRDRDKGRRGTTTSKEGSSTSERTDGKASKTGHDGIQ